MSVVIITENFVEYHIDDSGVLLKMLNKGITDRSVTIKHILDSGHVINALGKHFAEYEEFYEIVVSDEICEVKTEAFAFCYAKKVRWSSGCKKIPALCFRSSRVNEVTNVDHVTSICREAFAASKLKTFRWPTCCKKIPARCFIVSYLSSISNIDHVKSVGAGAFEACYIDKLVWPSHCPVIPRECFRNTVSLRNITNLQNVLSIEERAFFGLQLENVDLSNAAISTIGANAFNGTDKKEISLPYYLDDSVFIDNEELDPIALMKRRVVSRR